MQIQHRKIHLLTLCWLSVGVMTFLLAWCHWFISIPITAAMCFIIHKFYGGLSNKDVLCISKRQFIYATIIAITMMILCGIGGYVVQSNDQYYRNSWFVDIVNYDWPIYNVKEGLYMCYYFTFWLIPALFAKLFQSIEFGFFAQLIWISVGFVLLFLEVCIYIGKVKLGILLIIYTFSGLKIIECLLYFPIFGGDTIRNTILTLSTNGSPGIFHAGPIVQLLYDPFNQTIPLFLAMILILNKRKSLFIGFIYSLVLYYAPFPFIGLAPIVIYYIIKNTNFSNIYTWLCSWFNLYNIIALLLILIIGFFYMANINASHQGIRPTNNIYADVYSFILYMIFEFFIFIYLCYSECSDKKLLWLIVLSVAFMGWFQIGEHNDFCFRTNMPLIFILCMLTIKKYYNRQTLNRIKRIIICVLLIGGIPAQIHPLLRIISTGCIVTKTDQSILNKHQSFYNVTQMYVMQQKTMRNLDFGSIFGKGQEFDWTVNSLKASPDSFFFKYLAR